MGGLGKHVTCQTRSLFFLYFIAFLVTRPDRISWPLGTIVSEYLGNLVLLSLSVVNENTLMFTTLMTVTMSVQCAVSQCGGFWCMNCYHCHISVVCGSFQCYQPGIKLPFITCKHQTWGCSLRRTLCLFL